MKKTFTILSFCLLAAVQLRAQCNPDTEPPVLHTIPELCYNFLPISKTVPVYVFDLIIDVQDNCSGTNKLGYSIRSVGEGTGFPTDTAGNPVTTITFTCSSYGIQQVEVWVRDEAGNTACATVQTVLADNLSVCNFDPIMGNGCAQTETEKYLHETTWYFDLFPPVNFHPCLPHPPYTSACLQNIFFGKDSAAFRPSLDQDPLDGVSTFDLILINKHILDIQPLTAPFKMLAADANNSHSLSTFDIVELRKLILGIYPKLPHRESWGFVRKDFVFPNPGNPFATPVPASYTYTPSNWDFELETDFIGYKIGDINGDAAMNNMTTGDDRSTLRLLLPNELLQPGETKRIPLTLAENIELAGMQFAFEFDPQVLEVSTVLLGQQLMSDGTEFPGAFFAVPQSGRLTLSWDKLNPVKLTAGEPLLFLEITARQPTALEQVLRLQTGPLRPEMYTADNEISHLILEFSTLPAPGQTHIFPPAPNPSNGPVTIPLLLFVTSSARLELFDLNGRQLYFWEAILLPGFHHLEVPTRALSRQSAVLCYRVTVGEMAHTGRLCLF
ncbi:MAG: hypothetical protein IPH12_11790 [Saprospirales bacterium]|nr:hypothetical protein [Saprospirales bacterium]